MFEVKTREMGDERSKIFKEFLTRSRQFGADSGQAANSAQTQKPAGPEQPELLSEPRLAIPLQNMEKKE